MNKKKISAIISILVLILILFILTIVLTYMSDSKNSIAQSTKINAMITFDGNYKTKEQIEIKDYEMNNDYDSDGLSNKEELKAGTNIYKKDTDNDGINDYIEINKLNTDPLISDEIKDGVKIFYGYNHSDNVSISDLQEEITIENTDLGISLTTNDVETKVFNKIYPFIPNDETLEYYKGFYLFNIKSASISISKTSAMDDIVVFYYDEINLATHKIDYKIENDKIIFKVNNPQFPILITSETSYKSLEKNNYIIIKSKLPFLNGFNIYQVSKKIFGDNSEIVLPEENIATNGLTLKKHNVGKIKGFFIDRIASLVQSNNENGSKISSEKLTLSSKELYNYFSTKEENFKIGKHTFFINNFNTDLNRKSHAAGLTFIPAYFKNREIPLEQNYFFEEFRKTTKYDFDRDIKAYEDIINKNFGDYTFTYSVPDKASLDIIENPDKQVYKFIEMYDNFFFTNRDTFEIKEMKEYSNTIETVINTLKNGNYIIIGLNNSEKGHFLLAYDIIGNPESSVLKLKVFDPNYYSNKINGKTINNTLYITPQVESIVTDKETVKHFGRYEFYYNPVNSDQYTFSNKNYNIEFFNVN